MLRHGIHHSPLEGFPEGRSVHLNVKPAASPHVFAKHRPIDLDFLADTRQSCFDAIFETSKTAHINMRRFSLKQLRNFVRPPDKPVLNVLLFAGLIARIDELAMQLRLCLALQGTEVRELFG